MCTNVVKHREKKVYLLNKNNQTGIFSVTLASEVTIYDLEYAVGSLSNFCLCGK